MNVYKYRNTYFQKTVFLILNIRRKFKVYWIRSNTQFLGVNSTKNFHQKKKVEKLGREIEQK